MEGFDLNIAVTELLVNVMCYVERNLDVRLSVAGRTSRDTQYANNKPRSRSRFLIKHIKPLVHEGGIVNDDSVILRPQGQGEEWQEAKTLGV